VKMMKKFRVGGAAFRLAALAVLLILACAGSAAAAEDGGLLPLGAEAPLFQGVDLDGQPFSLEEKLAGKAVFLVFWSIF
jgi:hypothetical protein